MRSLRAAIGLAAISLAVPAVSFADFQYTETTTITGGSIVRLMKMAGTFSRQARQANEPVTATVYVKGNRMARISPLDTEIIDLDKETITRIDNQHKTYTVMTFQQMKQQIEDAAREAQKRQATKEETPADPNAKVSFDVKVRNTSKSQQVAGLNANESILTMTMNAENTKTGEKGSMAITNDMWMVPEVPGYSEVREFEKRFAEKMGTVFRGALSPALLASMQPGSNKGMAELVKEMSKLKGTPVLQVMRMGTTANGQPLPAASEAPIPESNGPDMPSAGEVAKEGAKESVASSISSKLGGLGGFGGFGHKKKKEEPKPEPQADKAQSGQQQPPVAVLMESKTEMTSFSRSAVDTSKFDIPAGYKQVEPRAPRNE